MTPDSRNKLTAPFWVAAARGELQISCCEKCKTDIWYPQDVCPQCKEELSWRRLQGRATLLSWTTVRRQINGAFEVPYTPAIVIPDDAPEVQLVTQLVLPEGLEPRCDMALQVAFEELRPLQGKPFVAPVFRALETT